MADSFIGETSGHYIERKATVPPAETAGLSQPGRNVAHAQKRQLPLSWVALHCAGHNNTQQIFDLRKLGRVEV